MLVAMQNREILAKDTIDAWHQSLRLILKEGETTWDEGRKLLEVCNVILTVKNPFKGKKAIDPYFKEFGTEIFNRVQNTFKNSKDVNGFGVSYAQRIYEHHGINQIEKAIAKLKNNPYTKSATFTLLDPENDQKHIPCVASMDFKIRQKKLLLTVLGRSIDAAKKLPIDLFSLAEIQKEVAGRLGIKAGPLTVFIASLHIYKEDFDRAATIVTRWRWNNKAKTWDAELKDPNHYVNLENGYRRFLKFLDECLTKARVEGSLDVGCGTGEVASLLSNKSKKAYGIDLSPKMIRKARKNYPQVRFTIGNALVLPYKDRFFELIVSRGILISHLGKGRERKFIKECSRVLKPNGYLIFDFLQKISLEEKDLKREKSVLNKDSIKKLLKPLGFKIIAFENNGEKRVNSVCAVKLPERG